MRETISLFLELVDLLEKIVNVVLFGSALFLELRYLLVLLGDFFLVLIVLLLGLFDVLGHDIPIFDEIKNIGLLIVSLSSEVLNFSGKSIHTSLGDVLLVLSVLLLSSDSILVVGEAIVLSVEVLVALLKLSNLGSHLIDIDLKCSLGGLKLTTLLADIVALGLKCLKLTVFGLVVHLLVLVLTFKLANIVLQVVDLTILFDLHLFEVLDLLILFFDLGLKVVLLSLEKLGISVKLDLILLKFVDLMLLFGGILQKLEFVGLEGGDLGLSIGELLLELVDLFVLGLNVLLKVLLLGKELMNSVILSK